MRPWMGLLFLFFPFQSLAYTPTITMDGAAVRWSGQPNLWFAGNPRNQSGLSEGAFFDSAVRSLQRWKSASGGSVGFEYWQGTDPGVYVPASAFDGLSTIYFASNSGSANLSPNVLGLTQVWYDTKSGEILETDIVLNDRAFRFTTRETDTSGYGSGGASYTSGKSNVFIENVLTHELGHSLGLSHSAGLQSTMLYMESPEQAHLGCDDLTAVRALYPAGDSGARGAITGQVVTESGTPIFGAHVLAVSRRRGTVMASALTDKAGNYRIDALEAGDYYLVAEPFYPGGQTLPPFYSGMKLDHCSGRPFARTALTDSDQFTMLPMQVTAGGAAAAPTITARCNTNGGAAIVGNTGAAAFRSAPTVFDGFRDGAGFGLTDRFSFGGTNYYRLKGVSGRLELHVLSYSLYSPVRPWVSLLSASGSPVDVPVFNTVYEGTSGFANLDSAIIAEDLPVGDYILQVRSERVELSLYPGGPVSVDSVPFLMVTGSLNEESPTLARSLPVNARCRMEEGFGSYSSPGGTPYRRSSDEDGGVGFCGTTSEWPGSGDGGSGPSSADIAGWFLPFAAMAAMARALRGSRLGGRTREAS